MNEDDDAIKLSELERQLKRQQKEKYEHDRGIDGRPRDHGDMLEALIREHGPQGRPDIYRVKK